jgi:hypothetical protein
VCLSRLYTCPTHAHAHAHTGVPSFIDMAPSERSRRYYIARLHPPSVECGPPLLPSRPSRPSPCSFPSPHGQQSDADASAHGGVGGSGEQYSLGLAFSPQASAQALGGAARALGSTWSSLQSGDAAPFSPLLGGGGSGGGGGGAGPPAPAPPVGLSSLQGIAGLAAGGAAGWPGQGGRGMGPAQQGVPQIAQDLASVFSGMRLSQVGGRRGPLASGMEAGPHNLGRDCQQATGTAGHGDI